MREYIHVGRLGQVSRNVKNKSVSTVSGCVCVYIYIYTHTYVLYIWKIGIVKNKSV